MGRRAKSTAILRQSFASRTSTTETQSATPSMLSAISTFVPAPVITGTSTSEQEVDFGGYDQLHVQTPQSWLLPPFPRSADPPFTNLPNLSAPPFSMPEPENLLGQYTNAPAASSAPAPINGFWDTPAGQSFAVPSNQSNGSTAAYNPFWMFQNAPNVEQTSNNFTQLPAPIDIPIAQPSDPRAAQAPQIDSQTIPLTLNTPSPCSQAAAAASIPAEPVYLKMTPISSSHLDAQGNPMNFVDWCSANHKVAPPDGAIYPVFPRIAWDSHTKALFNQFTSTTHPLLPHYSPSVNRCLSKLAAATTFPELATAFVGQRLASVCDAIWNPLVYQPDRQPPTVGWPFWHELGSKARDLDPVLFDPGSRLPNRPDELSSYWSSKRQMVQYVFMRAGLFGNMYTPCTGEFERIMRDDSREPFAAEAGNVAGISLAPSTLPGHLAQFYAECPFGCIVSEALLIQDLRAGQADHALTSLIVAYSLRYSEDASVRQRSEELFAFASDILLGRVWSNDSQELFNNGIAFCLIARWWQLKKQYRKSLTLFLVASMFARHYLNLNYEPRDNFRSYYSLKQQTQIQICNTIAWVSSAHLIMPAIGLDFESECMFGVRPALPPPTLNIAASALYELREGSSDRIEQADEMVMRAFNDVAEMAHCVDTSYWLMLKPVIHDKKEVFMRPLDDNTLPNQCSMRYQGTIAYLNAGESFQSRVACASFLVGKIRYLVSFEHGAGPNDSPFVASLYALTALQQMTALVCESAEAKQQLLKQETCDITLEALRLLCHATVKTPPKKVAPPYDWTQNMALSMLSELLSCCYVGFNVVFLACRVQLEAGAQYIAGIKITMNKLDTLFNGTWKTMMSTGRRKSLQGFRLEEPIKQQEMIRQQLEFLKKQPALA